MSCSAANHHSHEIVSIHVCQEVSNSKGEKSRKYEKIDISQIENCTKCFEESEKQKGEDVDLFMNRLFPFYANNKSITYF